MESTIQTEVLSDLSIAYNLVIDDKSDGAVITFACRDEQAAIALQESLRNNAVSIEVDAA